MITTCQAISTKKPCVYKLGFINRSKRRSSIVCIENHVYDIEYAKCCEVFSESGSIKRIVINDEEFDRSYILLDRSWDNSYSTIKIFFEQIYAIRSVISNDAYSVAVQHGFRGSLADWFKAMRGPRGYSAYELACQHGFEGTEEEWLDSIKAKHDDCQGEISKEDFDNLEARVIRAENAIDNISNSCETSAQELNNMITEVRNSTSDSIASIQDRIDSIIADEGKEWIVWDEESTLPEDGSICFVQATVDSLDSIPITPGAFIVLGDKGEIYVDTTEGVRAKIASNNNSNETVVVEF